ncbi:RidA family protein [Variovorax sp. EL159]|uniref:RidA family protein n=1 Tax=Variovorax sp. EL159 TaxID=1566270 RepID=UPI0008909C8F|nr:RidA family protein [Variovorax sp. EL159]SCX71890.1 reactive intermediate/imine deaminase [Variovorax sp. EL159]
MKHSNPPALHPPTGYSHVVEVVARRTLYVSGQIALDAEGRLVGPDDLHAQTTQVFENLRTALAASESGLRDVVKLTVFVSDMSRLAAFREARDRFFSAPLPACSLVEVSRLARPDLLIEIEAVAVVE